MHRKSLLFLLNFSFYSIFSETETLEKPVSTTAYEKFGGIFFSLYPVYMNKINVIQSFHQEMYVIKESCNFIG